jgi:hypothetical protein
MTWLLHEGVEATSRLDHGAGRVHQAQRLLGPVMSGSTKGAVTGCCLTCAWVMKDHTSERGGQGWKTPQDVLGERTITGELGRPTKNRPHCAVWLVRRFPPTVRIGGMASVWRSMPGSTVGTTRQLVDSRMNQRGRRESAGGGAGGFISSHLVKQLKADGHWVRSANIVVPEVALRQRTTSVSRDQANCGRALKVDGGIDEVRQLAAGMGIVSSTTLTAGSFTPRRSSV